MISLKLTLSSKTEKAKPGKVDLLEWHRIIQTIPQPTEKDPGGVGNPRENIQVELLH